jgi:hypothetical protein
MSVCNDKLGGYLGVMTPRVGGFVQDSPRS